MLGGLGGQRGHDAANTATSAALDDLLDGVISGCQRAKLAFRHHGPWVVHN